MSPAPVAPASDLRRRALHVLFWSVALSLGFNALFGDMGLIHAARQTPAHPNLIVRPHRTVNQANPATAGRPRGSARLRASSAATATLPGLKLELP